MAKIAFVNKSQVASYDAAKFNAQDANEIKTSVNYLYDNPSGDGDSGPFTEQTDDQWDGSDKYISLTADPDLTLDSGSRSGGMLYVTTNGFDVTINGETFNVSGSANAMIVYAKVGNEYIFSVNTNTIAVAVPLPAGDAPTGGVVDDTANTFGFTVVPGITTLSLYEQTLNGGSSYATVTANPIVVGNLNKAIGQVGVRQKAVVGVSSASATLYNATAFNSSLITLGTPTSPTTGTPTDTTVPITFAGDGNEDNFAADITLAADTSFAAIIQTITPAALATGGTFTGLTASTGYIWRIREIGDGVTYADSANTSSIAATTAAPAGNFLTFGQQLVNATYDAPTNAVHKTGGSAYTFDTFALSDQTFDDGDTVIGQIDVPNGVQQMFFGFSTASTITATTDVNKALCPFDAASIISWSGSGFGAGLHSWANGDWLKITRDLSGGTPGEYIYWSADGVSWTSLTYLGAITGTVRFVAVFGNAGGGFKNLEKI